MRAKRNRAFGAALPVPAGREGAFPDPAQGTGAGHYGARTAPRAPARAPRTPPSPWHFPPFAPVARLARGLLLEAGLEFRDDGIAHLRGGGRG